MRQDQDAGTNPGTSQGLPDTARDTRWRDWIARGAASDRRTSHRMTGLILLITIGLCGWLATVLIAR